MNTKNDTGKSARRSNERLLWLKRLASPNTSQVSEPSRQVSKMATGPWGSNGSQEPSQPDQDTPNNPWTSSEPTDISSRRKAGDSASWEEMLKRSLGGGNGSGGGPGGLPSLPGGGKLWRWGVVILGGLWLVGTSFHVVPPEKEGVVTQLGSYIRTVGPGIRWTLPAPIERIQMEDVLAIRTLPIGSPSANDENFVLTRDQNIIDMAYEVRWSIRDPELYLFQIADQKGTIREVAESAMRAAVANFDLVQAIGPGRSSIELDVRQRMQILLDQYRSGVFIQGIAIRQADPPQQVNEAFKQVTTARQQRESALNDARAFAQRVMEGARGETAEFDKIYVQYKLSPTVTRRRLYYETMEQVLSDVNKTVVEPRGVTPYLPLNEVSRRAAAPTATVGQGNQ